MTSSYIHIRIIQWFKSQSSVKTCAFYRPLQSNSVRTDISQDMCPDSASAPVDFDIEMRGFDSPVSDIYGPYDAGADETYVDDIIFSSGFDN